MALLGDVVATWQAVRAASGRLDKRRHLAGLFSRLGGDDLRLAASYLSGDLATAPVGAGWASIQQALDGLGAPAGEPVALADADRTFATLAETSGPGSQKRRSELLRALFGRSSAEEREFLVGLMSGELRQGAQRPLMLDALAEARGLDVAALRRAVMHAGSLADVLAALERGGAEALAGVQLRPLVPVEPMLAAAAGDLAEALAELGGSAAAEWKLDGIRVQLHKDGDAVRVFTRSLRDVTEEAHALVELARGLPAQSAILDGEAVSAGARFFDLLYVDGVPLVDHPDEERRARLEALLPRERVIPRRMVGSVAEIEAAMAEALAAGQEGLVLKAPSAPYAAGRRGSNWRKVKPAVTLDLVILGAEWGHGRRRGVLSNLHLGVRDAADPTRFYMLGKTFKGMTDQMLRDQTELLLAIAVEKGEHLVRVRPEIVVEVAFDSVMASTRYDSGFGMRFARVKRYRPDKRATDATTLEEIRALATR